MHRGDSFYFSPVRSLVPLSIIKDTSASVYDRIRCIQPFCLLENAVVRHRQDIPHSCQGYKMQR